MNAKSLAFGIHFGNDPESPIPQKICADAWFGRFEAGRYKILEQTIRTSPETTLTLLVFMDGAMLEHSGICGRRPLYEFAVVGKVI